MYVHYTHTYLSIILGHLYSTTACKSDYFSINKYTTPQPAFLGELRCRRPTETTSVSALGHPQNLEIPRVDFWQGNCEDVIFISCLRASQEGEGRNEG